MCRLHVYMIFTLEIIIPSGCLLKEELLDYKDIEAFVLKQFMVYKF